MTLFAPNNLLWLLAFLPPLILMYFLKIKRQPHIISSIMLWHKSLHDLQANAPFQRLRRNLLLILQILLFLLLIAALARPIMQGSAFEGKHLILLIDRSASMQTRDEDGATRFEKALDIARSIADDPKKKEMMIISFANQASVEIPFTASPVEIRRALNRLKPTDTSTEITDALRIATSAARGKEDVTVVVLSDGIFGPLPEIAKRNFSVDFIGLGRRCRNAAVTGLSVRRPLEKNEPGIHLFVEVSNFSPGPITVPLEIHHEEVLTDAARWLLPPGGTVGKTFRFTGIQEGLITIHLDAEDDLKADNEVSVLVRPPRAPRILLVTEGNIFLENALKAIPGVELSVNPIFDAGSPGEEDFDVVIFDKVTPPSTTPVRGVLYLGVVPPQGVFRAEGELESPLFGDGDWNETHPVNRYADYSNLFVEKALKVSLPEQAVVLLESRDGPLMAACENRDEKTVAVFFDVRQSDWPFHVSFPVFLNNAVLWLYGRGEAGAEGTWIRTGSPLTLPPGGGDVWIPDRGRVPASGEAENPVAFSQTETAGIYAFTGKGGTESRFAVNLVSPAESDVTPEPALDIPGERIVARSSKDVVYREYWPWLLLAAVVLLLVEWWVYHRRAI
ncbi:MAG: VWA domain-containing protein [Planctomycetota bacterium]|jgi:hypothetical protein